MTPAFLLAIGTAAVTHAFFFGQRVGSSRAAEAMVVGVPYFACFASCALWQGWGKSVCSSYPGKWNVCVLSIVGN